jgi:predicted acetylornithine/succinylornithine family transaminase
MVSTSIDTGNDIRHKDSEHILQTYARAPFVLEHGQGMTVTDTTGKTYLDFGAGIAVNALGHADPEIAAAVQDQMARLGHVSNLFHSGPQAELAEMLCDLSFADRVFFCNSGTEANEAAIKIARKAANQQRNPDKSEIVAFTGAFHGRTVGALSITPREKYQAPFRPLMPGVIIAEFNNIEAAQQAIGPKTCAVFVEPIQGEGGIHAAAPEFLKVLRDLCDQHGALLVFDEIQCGLGRTGKLWAHEWSGVRPDIMTLAKALGGGLPIGAVLMTEAAAKVLQPGAHGSTFAGGPIACRAAQVVVQRVSGPAMLSHISQMGDLLYERLAELNSPHIRQIRAHGLMVGVEMDSDVGPLIEQGYERGVIMLSAGPEVLRLLPPLIVQEEHIHQLVECLSEILG